MKAAPSHSARNSAATPPPLKFKSVVIYEDFAAGERGERFFGKLVAARDDDCVSRHNLWSFPALVIPEMRNIAASAAAAADIVILALSGKDELPAAVKEWIEMWIWLIEDTHPALVALFENPNGESGPIRRYLRLVTASKHLDFFPDEAWEDEEVAAFATL